MNAVEQAVEMVKWAFQTVPSLRASRSGRSGGSAVVRAAERRAAQFNRGREFVPAGFSKKEARDIQKTNGHDTMIASVEMLLHDLAAERSPLQRSARRRSLLAKIDGAKALSDKEKAAFRQRVERAK